MGETVLRWNGQVMEPAGARAAPPPGEQLCCAWPSASSRSPCLSSLPPITLCAPGPDLLYLHGKNPLVGDGNNYIITGDSGQVRAELCVGFRVSWAWEGGPRRRGVCTAALAPDAHPALTVSLAPCCAAAQGMTGGTIGGMVVSDLILGGWGWVSSGVFSGLGWGVWVRHESAGAACTAGGWVCCTCVAGRPFPPPALPAGRKNPWADVYDPSRAPPFKSLLEVRWPG